MLHQPYISYVKYINNFYAAKKESSKQYTVKSGIVKSLLHVMFGNDKIFGTSWGDNPTLDVLFSLSLNFSSRN